MRRAKPILIIVAVFLIFAIVICLVRPSDQTNTENPDNNNEIVESQTIEYFDKINPSMDNMTTTVPAPDFQEPEEVPVPDTDQTFKNLSDGFVITVPDGYTLTYSGNTYYIRNQDNSIQIALVVTSMDVNTTAEVFTSRNTYFNRMTAFYDGEEHRTFNIGSSDREKKHIGSFTVSYEKAEAWFKNDNDPSIYKTTAYNYYTILRENEEESGRGVILAAFTDTDSNDVIPVMDEILESLSDYEPTADELAVSYELSSYHSELEDQGQIAYPSNWKVTKNNDGMLIITSTDDPSSPYAGMIIEYLPDVNKKIVDDYAQFSGGYEYNILLPYFTQPVGDEAFNYRSVVTETDLHAQIGKKECIKFDITDEIIPISKAIQYSMMSDDFIVKSVRYTFKSNNVDCMLNFIIPNDYCETLIQELLAHSQFR